MNTELEQTFRIIDRIHKELKSSPDGAQQYLQVLRCANTGNLLAGISHTFNNILGGILGYSQLLKEELPEDSAAYQHAAVIEKASKRASKLISQLQTYSLRQPVRPMVVDPKRIVEEVVAIVQSSVKNITVSTSFSHAGTKVIADFPAMCHALLNLCLNARDAMPDGGELRIETSLARKAKNGSTNRNTQRVIFRVSDTGRGIAEDLLPYIFVPFVTTQEDSMASGMGLAITNGIVKDHDGSIEVVSSPGKGTTFIISLPQAQFVAKTPASVRRRKAKVVGHGEVIMVVDDEEDLREMAKKIFEKKGFRVLVADSGKSAIELFEKHVDEVQLVILDMIMPGVDGAEVYKRLKSIRKNAKVILTSGYINNAPFQEILDKGEDTFVPKPWDLPDLIVATSRVLAEK